jgi:hypothetical protein
MSRRTEKIPTHFFSRLKDWSVSTVQGMSTEQCLYRGRVERQRPACARSRSEKWSVYCEHKLPRSMAELLHNTGKTKEIFSIDAQAFSVAQNDECESSITNALKRIAGSIILICHLTCIRTTLDDTYSGGTRPGAPGGTRSATLRDSE